MENKRTKAQVEADALRTGRPPKPKAEKQGYQVRVNITLAESKQIRKEASKAGLSLSAYLLEFWREKKGK